MTTEMATTLESADIQKILELLPHRYPFLMVDRITAIDKDRSAIGHKNVTANEPHFQGHFPNYPVMPGVLIIEGMAQTAGAICQLATGGDNSSIVYFMTIDAAKFRKPVVPGDHLQYHVKQSKKRGNIWKFDCVGTVDDARVAEASISAMLVAAGAR
ncbi:3-hydroxyacyl-ACP dehydratase FabZ [Aureimonas jatrophae]|uniref:3-hydroxyacyl-[acyl-carrier-protein] dehydratase FabZ n=1 Tax=Aureimonas jatrophae TaxID=1166073 RepID=A0A1H0GWF2_9HYPH|nr:3-hydroxyacyl-ACP dehydratase FabZ [Aureimonas jatrophae]MBB3949839.1 3-hydroxyacyl-[acyl-carrier-protein] dehydratase [Aureimonas jatrophae]SDO11366.1 3-hydroxyacyl-[acyl-carrier-protein] dehydratase [Aureimonas jatrophae]